MGRTKRTEASHRAAETKESRVEEANDGPEWTEEIILSGHFIPAIKDSAYDRILIALCIRADLMS